VHVDSYQAPSRSNESKLGIWWLGGLGLKSLFYHSRRLSGPRTSSVGKSCSDSLSCRLPVLAENLAYDDAGGRSQYFVWSLASFPLENTPPSTPGQTVIRFPRCKCPFGHFEVDWEVEAFTLRLATFTSTGANPCATIHHGPFNSGLNTADFLYRPTMRIGVHQSLELVYNFLSEDSSVHGLNVGHDHCYLSHGHSLDWLCTMRSKEIIL
jgi:hypothetical protein